MFQLNIPDRQAVNSSSVRNEGSGLPNQRSGRREKQICQPRKKKDIGREGGLREVGTEGEDNK